MEMGVESTITGTGLTCFCKQEAGGSKVRVETYRKKPKNVRNLVKRNKFLLILSVYTSRSQACSKKSRCDRSGKLLALLFKHRQLRIQFFGRHCC